MNRMRSQQFNLSEAGTWLRRPSIISWRMAGASLDQARPFVPDPPAVKITMHKMVKNRTAKPKFYICADVSHTHTLLRTVIANSDVECILRAKNTPIKPDRKGLMTRGEKQCGGILATSLLDATYPSEPSRYLPWKIAATVQWKKEKAETNCSTCRCLA